MEADTGLGQTIDIVATGAGLDLHCGVPETAVPVEAGTGLALHNAISFSGVAAIKPHRGMGATVIFWDAEGGHGITCHACEAVPLSVHVAVTQWWALRFIQLMLCVPPRLVQSDVSRARVQGWEQE